MRVFVAVPVDPPSAAIIGAWLARTDLPGRRVPPANWHITLRFVGTVDEVQADRLAAALDDIDEVDPFSVEFGDLGGFPTTSDANVAYIRLGRGSASLQTLATLVDDAVESIGLGPEERLYAPHLTVSRIRPGQDLRAAADAAGDLGLSAVVTEFSLYRTHLGSGGARYERLETYSLL